MTVAALRNRIMEALVYNGPMTRDELADELQVHVGALGAAIDLLWQEGQVEGEPIIDGKRIQAVRNG
jgi:DNA-binding MarR family transcriptional regulator